MAKSLSTSAHKKKWRIRDELIYDSIMHMVQADPDKAVRPEDVAMMIRKDDWQGLLKRIRLFAGKLAQEGYVNIIRKGVVVDPSDFKGVYRLAVGERSAEYTPRMPAE